MEACIPLTDRRAACRRVVLALAAGVVVEWAQAQGEQVVEVIGTAPLPGFGVDRNLLPYGSIVVRRDALDRAQADSLSDHLARRLPGVQSADIQGSPFQADITFRGHRASGLLGAAQGLSVYLDGVRINEPFGDVVNWDMIPDYSIQSLVLVPGANPAFGLNTLGGAIALTTASGQSSPGVRIDASLGSFGRARVDVSQGRRSDDGWHSYVAGSAFGEHGWREHSPGSLGHLFGKFGHSDGESSWDVSVLAGRSRLVGNGLLPLAGVTEAGRVPDLYAQRRSLVYTHPDRTRNTVGHAAFQLNRRVDAQVEVQALAYVRGSRRASVNGDVARTGPDPAADGANATLNTTRTRQSAYGVAGSAAGRAGAHQWQIGGTLDASFVHYRQFEQAGAFDASRGVVAGTAPATPSAAVDGRALQLGVYATDTWRIGAATAVTATARLNQARVGNRLTTVDDATGESRVRDEERFSYRSVNPALGLVQQLAPGLAVFGNLARNTRVPTAIELGCADPAEPCRLPAGLQSDPYLKQVRSSSLEAGMRWRSASGQQVELSAYRTDNRDDILFGSVSATGQLGYFQNFPRTRHQGLDADWSGRWGALEMTAAYSRLDATYQAAGTLRIGERNLAAERGMRVAGMPRHTLKVGFDWRVLPGVTIGADAQASSRRGVLGNEDGRLADGQAATHDLSLPGCALANLRLGWQPRAGLEVILKLHNAFDRRYETYGALGATVFDAQGTYTGDERRALFVAPGAPRSVFVGVRLRH